MILYNLKPKLGVVSLRKNILSQVKPATVNLTSQEQLHRINAAFKENTAFKLYKIRISSVIPQY